MDLKQAKSQNVPAFCFRDFSTRKRSANDGNAVFADLDNLKKCFLLLFSRAYDRHLTSGFRTTCVINHCHNHELPEVKAPSMTEVGSETREKLIQLLEIGHTPDSALEAIKADLREMYGENFLESPESQRYCPNVEYCYKYVTPVMQHVN